ncbi:hypothetical protein D3C81_2173710 [compost metagenome]
MVMVVLALLNTVSARCSICETALAKRVTNSHDVLTDSASSKVRLIRIPLLQYVFQFCWFAPN